MEKGKKGRGRKGKEGEGEGEGSLIRFDLTSALRRKIQKEKYGPAPSKQILEISRRSPKFFENFGGKITREIFG
jgi:hypothetical protein